ncbi:hypothetical protein EZZ81_07575 [Pseudomonas viridiflava]|uniref:Uncharacterized protein n=1 Tax=Pseudomonas viridiflava TaxID=33069 RepID=A0AA46VU47_PSEVI|nr:hypothetical protein EZZ81_07575 [Pseudomonas viridiflava]
MTSKTLELGHTSAPHSRADAERPGRHSHAERRNDHHLLNERGFSHNPLLSAQQRQKLAASAIKDDSVPGPTAESRAWR